MAASTGPVLVVGLDMGDGGLIRYWARQGHLPHFAALAAAGAALELDSTADVLHTSTWPTFATGVLPGRHGVYYPYQPTPGQQFARQIDAGQYGASTFWQKAGGALRTLVYDIPETFPEAAFTGRAIYDWGTWAQYGQSTSQPPALLKELKVRFGPYPLGYEAMRLGFDSPQGVQERLLKSVRYKADTAKWLLERADWDLAVIGFGETHCGGHYLWPAGTANVETGPPVRFEPLLSIYAALDDALGVLMASLPSNVTVVVVSGDGVRDNRCGWHLLPAALDRLGYTSRGASPADGPPPKPSLLGRAAQLMPQSAKKRISDSLPLKMRNRLSLLSQAAGLDWSRTRAFALPTDLEGCVRINVRGREPQGIVESGAQYEDLCSEIRTRLEELVNPNTGRPAVRHVWIRNEIFPGPKQEELPDLMVTWSDEAPIVSLTSPRLGTVEGVNPDKRSGTHSTTGFLIAKGPALPQGYEGRGRLVDVPATVLKLSGVQQVSGLDGGGLELPQASPLLPSD
jgi:predicted AlkP superfamily phosphohydrolase/phosphomutase